MSRPADNTRSFQPPEVTDFESVIDRFEEAWLSGMPPEISAFLPNDPAIRLELLAELIQIDWEYRFKAGDVVSEDDYRARYPEVFAQSESLSDKLSQAAREFVERRSDPASHKASGTRGLQPGAVLGNYTILRQIGQGGMGQVFEARHRRLQRVVALKVLSPAMQTDANALRRFQREAKAAGLLSHPNIVTAHDADESDGFHYLVMEHIGGLNLTQYLKEHGPMPVAQAVDCILQTARGLEYAHRQGVVHRDIKPSNLLLDESGTVKILDLGLARNLSQSGDHATSVELTSTGAVLGTVDFMAPEQTRDSKRVDQRSDIYSLGCTLHYLLTGEVVFSGTTILVKLQAHRDKAAPDLRIRRPDVPAELNRIFRKMLAKNPDERYASMTEVISALTACDLSAIEAMTGQADSLTEPISLGESTSLQSVDTQPTPSMAGSTPTGGSSPCAGSAKTEPIDRQDGQAKSRIVTWFRSPLRAAVTAVALLTAIALGLRQLPLFDRPSGKASGSKSELDSKTNPPNDDNNSTTEIANEPDNAATAKSSEASASNAETKSDQPLSEVPPEAPKPVREWKPGPPAIATVPGLIPRPAIFADIGRWQINTVLPRTSVNSIAWSKTGLIAVADQENVIRVYDAATRKLLRMLAGHREQVSCVAFSPDGSRLASSSADKTICIWKSDGTRERVLTGSTGGIRSVSWDPTGERLASSDSDLRIWTLDGKPPLVVKTPLGNGLVAWSPDGSRIAEVSWEKTVRIRDTTGALQNTIQNLPSLPYSLAWRPDGSQLALGFELGDAQLFDADGKPGIVLKVNGVVQSLGWDSQGQKLAMASHNYHCYVWDVLLNAAFELPGIGIWANCAAAWNPDGSQFVIGDQTGNLRFWTVDGRSQGSLAGGDRQQHGLAWSGDNSQLATGGADGRVRIWSPAGELKRVLTKESARVNSVDWTKDGSKLASGCVDGIIRVSDSEGKPLKVFDAGGSWLMSVAWHPDGQRLATAGGPDLQVWNVNETSQPLRVAYESPNGIGWLAWAADGQHLAAALTGSKTHIWRFTDPQTASPPTVLDNANHWNVSWNHDGTRLAWGLGGDLWFWTPEKTEKLPLLNTGEQLRFVAWSPNSERMAFSATWPTIRVIAPDGTAIKTLTGHGVPEARLAWSPDSLRLSSVAADTTLRTWDVTTGEAQWIAVPLSGNNAATFNAGGELLFGDPDVVEQELVYCLKESSSAMELFTPSQFHRLLDVPWRGNPAPLNADQRAARWVLQLGGKLTLRVGDAEKEVASISELPEAAFRVLLIDFNNSQRVSDRRMKELAGLDELAYLSLTGTPITGEGLKHLAASKKLDLMSLQHTNLNGKGTEHLQLLKWTPRVGQWDKREFGRFWNRRFQEESTWPSHGKFMIRDSRRAWRWKR